MVPFEKPQLTAKEKTYVKKIQSKIEYCAYCQPYDEGEVVWIHGDKIDLNDLMGDCRIPERSKEKVARHLYCPSCGNSDFDLFLDVGIQSRFDKEVEKHMAEVYSLYGGEVRELEELLEQYPLLAYRDKLAKRIYKEIKGGKLPIATVEGKFYRARKVESSEVVTSQGMYNPPIGKPTEGRFNHAGQSHLYLASDKITAIKEVIAEEHSVLVWYQEFEIKEPVGNILNLSFDWENLTPSTSTLLLSLKVYGTIERTDRNKENWKPDYYLTRYIMDCAKSVGYKGIKYNSVKESYSYDLVLFYPKDIRIETLGNPRIEIFLNKDEVNSFTSDLLDG